MHSNNLTLVGQIYDAVIAPDKWPIFLDNLARSMNAHATRMRMLDNSGNCYNLIAGTGHDGTYDQQYRDYFTQVDLWNEFLARQSPGEIFNSQRFNSEFVRSEIYNDLFKYYDLFYGLGGNIAMTNNIIARIGVHRSRSLGPYSDEDIQLLQSLMPHLLRAFTLGKHFDALKSQVADLQVALNSSPSPLILIDEYGHAAFVNQRAESLLGDESGLSIVNNRLLAAVMREQAELEKLLQQAVATGARKGTESGGAMRITATNGENRYNLLITPYPNHSVSQLGLNTRICAAVFIHDTRQSGKLPAEVLNNLYGLTRSEIRLAEGILQGLTPAEAASQFGVSVNTTRSQLRSLFAKTDTQRQAELVRLLLGLTN